MIGEKFGRLLVLEEVDRPAHRKTVDRYYRCQCDCGAEHTTNQVGLRYGAAKSCGCLRREKSSARARRHGLSGHPLYALWLGMLNRCKPDGHKDYGLRGIRVCRRWTESFEAFCEDMGPRPGPEYSVDRRQVNGNYTPGNCRWATPLQQANNTRANRILEAFGESLTVSQWARRYGFGRGVLYARLDKGMSAEEALTTPLMKSGPNAPTAKLTADMVRDARRRRANGERVSDIARGFGLSYWTVYKAVIGETYAEVSP